MVTRPVARIPGLHDAWQGCTIALLADLHVGDLCPPDYLRRIVAITLRLNPDLVVLLGDLVSQPEAAGEELAAVLRPLRPPLGLLAVLGNHDYIEGGPGSVLDLLDRIGATVLVNSHRVLERGGEPLCLAGVDDWMHGWPDAAQALNGADAACPRILLAHNPDCAEELPPGLRVDFMLCGHTHGGQIRLPFGPPPFVSVHHRKYTAGLVAGPRCPVYISRGLGVIYLPFRLNCRPELPIVELRRA